MRFIRLKRNTKSERKDVKMHTAEIIGREYEWDTLEERVSRD